MQIEIRGAEKLSYRERQVVVLKEMGHSNAEVAKQLSLNANTVAALYYRAKQKGYQVVIILSGDALNLFSQEEAND